MTDDASDSKLTRTKQRWAAKGKFLTGRHSRPEEERLPPGQHLTKDWPVLDLGVTPRVTEMSFRLDVDGLVETPLSLNWAQFRALPRAHKVSDIHCVTTWSRYDNEWDGVATLDLLDRVMPKDGAQHVILTSSDGYTTNVPLADFAAADGMLVDSWQGWPLEAEHGGPMRLVLPHLYFWKSAKWLTRITFVAADKRGFWEERGYHNYADPWREQRYSDD